LCGGGGAWGIRQVAEELTSFQKSCKSLKIYPKMVEEETDPRNIKIEKNTWRTGNKYGR
jgi:hypothetical protein